MACLPYGTQRRLVEQCRHIRKIVDGEDSCGNEEWGLDHVLIKGQQQLSYTSPAVCCKRHSQSVSYRMILILLRSLDKQAVQKWPVKPLAGHCNFGIGH